jgi:exodeoxyribonuclease VII large subunit
VLKVLKRRFPAVAVRIYPVPVQGEGAAGKIAAAIDLADRRRDCDVLIVTRGGGSLEDLWAFNEEVLARAIATCSIPVISAVGHEVDVTISDLVADVRAPTPSAAAELAVPDQATWLASLARLAARLTQLARQALAARRERLTWLERRLAQRDPRHRLRQQAQRLDELESRLVRAARQGVAERGLRLRALLARLQAVSPARRLQRDAERLVHCRHRLRSAADRRLADYRARLAVAVRALNTVSPLATLERGYAIVFDPAGAVVRDAATLKPGDTLRARLARGSVAARVISAGEDET